MSRIEWKAPINQNGSLMPYPQGRYLGTNKEGVPIYENMTFVSQDTEWVLSLTFDSFDKGGRSAYRFIGRDENGNKWPMSIKQYIKMAKQVVMDRCNVCGRFGVVKQGQNFSLIYLDELNVPIPNFDR